MIKNIFVLLLSINLLNAGFLKWGKTATKFLKNTHISINNKNLLKHQKYLLKITPKEFVNNINYYYKQAYDNVIDDLNNLIRKKKKTKKHKEKNVAKNKSHIKRIKIVSWNLQNFSMKNEVKFKQIQNYIKNYFYQGADIILLQEIKDVNKKQINFQKLAFGYKTYVSNYLGRNKHKERYAILINPKLFASLKVLSIKEVKLRNYNKFQRPPYGIIFGNKFLLLNVHLIYGNSKQERIKELKALKKVVTNLLKYHHIQNNNYIIAGDFNLNKYEIKKVFRKANVTTDSLTTNANSYDHIITNKKIKRDKVSLINRTNISDHSPIRIILEINTKSTKSKKRL